MKLWHVIVGAALLATGPAGCMSYIAGMHNPQGEFDNAAGSLSLWLLFTHVFVWYFLPLFILLAGVGVLLTGARRASRE
jgi:hypothetical protein